MPAGTNCNIGCARGAAFSLSSQIDGHSQHGLTMGIEPAFDRVALHDAGLIAVGLAKLDRQDRQPRLSFVFHVGFDLQLSAMKRTTWTQVAFQHAGPASLYVVAGRRLNVQPQRTSMSPWQTRANHQILRVRQIREAIVRLTHMARDPTIQALLHCQHPPRQKTHGL